MNTKTTWPRHGLAAQALAAWPTLWRLTLLLLLGLLTPLRHAAAQTLVVATDSALAPAMAEVARSFETTRPGVSVQVLPGAPGALLTRMAQDQAIDLLAGADAQTVALGVSRRLLQAELRSVFATNALVLVVPASLNLPVQRLSDLTRPQVVRVAVGRAPAEPAGRYAREALDAQRLWTALQRKLVMADSVRDVLDLVASADVEAGLVYATDAAAAGDRVRVVQTLETTTPVRHLVHVSASSAQPALARAFAEHLRSDAARAVWQRFGFALP